jgi:hypothetical protein
MRPWIKCNLTEAFSADDVRAKEGYSILSRRIYENDSMKSFGFTKSLKFWQSDHIVFMTNFQSEEDLWSACDIKSSISEDSIQKWNAA